MTGGGIGLIISGLVIDSTVVVIVLAIAILVVNCLYYGPALLKVILGYRLKCKEQDHRHKMEEKQLQYEQSIGKEQAIGYEMQEKKMQMEHELRMKKLDKMGNSMIYSSAEEVIPPTDERYLN